MAILNLGGQQINALPCFLQIKLGQSGALFLELGDDAVPSGVGDLIHGRRKPRAPATVGSGAFPSRQERHPDHTMASIFTRIITGEIPGEFVFRTERWVGLLDIRPTVSGHVLLIPVAEAVHLADLPGATHAELGIHLARLVVAIKRVTGCPAVNAVLNDGPVAGQEIPHVHFHVVPRWANDGRGYRFSPQPGVGLAALVVNLRTAWNAA